MLHLIDASRAPPSRPRRRLQGLRSLGRAFRRHAGLVRRRRPAYQIWMTQRPREIVGNSMGVPPRANTSSPIRATAFHVHPLRHAYRYLEPFGYEGGSSTLQRREHLAAGPGRNARETTRPSWRAGCCSTSPPCMAKTCCRELRHRREGPEGLPQEAGHEARAGVSAVLLVMRLGRTRLLRQHAGAQPPKAPVPVGSAGSVVTTT